MCILMFTHKHTVLVTRYAQNFQNPFKHGYPFPRCCHRRLTFPGFLLPRVARLLLLKRNDDHLLVKPSLLSHDHLRKQPSPTAILDTDLVANVIDDNSNIGCNTDDDTVS